MPKEVQVEVEWVGAWAPGSKLCWEGVWELAFSDWTIGRSLAPFGLALQGGMARAGPPCPLQPLLSAPLLWFPSGPSLEFFSFFQSNLQQRRQDGEGNFARLTRDNRQHALISPVRLVMQLQR